MTNYIQKFFIIFLISSLTACATKEESGTAIGALTGGVFGAMLGEKSGNTFAGAAFGTILGGIVGNALGHKLDKNDQKLMANATEKALENTRSGKALKWHNPDNGHEGYITPIRTYKIQSGRYCREFVQEANIGGEKVKVYGKACRQPDGQWEVMSSNNDY
jgi:surface antigen